MSAPHTGEGMTLPPYEIRGVGTSATMTVSGSAPPITPRPVRLAQGDSEPPKPPAFNRIMGATSGPYEGNVRAFLALGLAAVYVVLLGYLTFEYVHNNREQVRDLVIGGWGALGSAFALIVGLYLGKRQGDGA